MTKICGSLGGRRRGEARIRSYLSQLALRGGGAHEGQSVKHFSDRYRRYSWLDNYSINICRDGKAGKGSHQSKEGKYEWEFPFQRGESRIVSFSFIVKMIRKDPIQGNFQISVIISIQAGGDASPSPD